MERTVPRSASDEVDLYLRTIYSLLRSTAEVQIRSLEQVHASMESSLHPLAGSVQIDVAAFLYTLTRLPEQLIFCKSVILGQSTSLFVQSGYDNIEKWQPVSAKARRRRCYFDRNCTLACLIASRSDIEDIIPNLVAFQIEWNKIHYRLQEISLDLISMSGSNRQAFSSLADSLGFSVEDLARIQLVWGEHFSEYLQAVRRGKMNLAVRLLGGSLSQYWRATSIWWENIVSGFPELPERPVYFISSNLHSVVNLLSGYAIQHEPEILDYIQKQDPVLQKEWEIIQKGETPASKENFFYYALKKAQAISWSDLDQLHEEREHGIYRFPSNHTFDVDAQVIDLSRINPAEFDPRLPSEDLQYLKHSDAVILNIDYPLGLAAYNLLSKIAEHVSPVLGVYIQGKAATLNGRVGDVMIPNVVHDEHSQNTYLFQNVFSADRVSPYLNFGTVLDNQKAVSVLGTFLQNSRYMDVFYRESFSDIEMESGAYLSAIYEMYRPQRHPVNEIVNLYPVPFDVGILHYASDTPLSKGRNLGSGTLSYFGMDSTYACSIAILRRILEFECNRQKAGC